MDIGVLDTKFTYKSKLQRIFNLQKRCVRLLFGEVYSFEHPEYYSTCARAKTFTEHMAQKDYALEHRGVDTSLLSLMSLVFFEIISTRGRGFGDIRDKGHKRHKGHQFGDIRDIIYEMTENVC